jgi:response regulator RpfG family c-di-GMP phosphodiesterase
MWDELRDKEIEKELFHKEILIIDDDPDITFCVRTILEEAKFDNIHLAVDYKTTVEHLQKSNPDLIFLNIGMHNKEGNRIMTSLRRSKDWRGIPVLVSVGPLEPTRVYEDTFKNAAILKHGKYVEQPRTRQSFTGLVRHMLLYGESNAGSQMLNVGKICPPGAKRL